MKRTAENGPLDSNPSGDAIHPYEYPTSQDQTPSCPNCQRALVLTTLPYDPYKVFMCEDCHYSIPYSQRMEPGTGNGETGSEHLQNFEGLVEKADAHLPTYLPYKVTKRPKENPMADQTGHGEMRQRTLNAFQADQPFPRMIHQEWETRNILSNLIYGFSYYQLTVGQKDRVDKAMRIFWDSHGLFSAQQAADFIREGDMEREALEIFKKKEAPAGDKPVEDMSTKEIAIKKLKAQSEKLERYYMAVAIMKQKVDEYQATLQQELQIPKLQEESKDALGYMNELARMLEQKEFLLGNMVYTFRTASEKLVSSLRSVAAVQSAVELVRELITPKKMSRYEEIIQDFVKTEPIAESFQAYLQTEEKKRPKELKEPNLEDMTPEQLTKFLETPETKKSSLTVEAGFWDTIKGWLNAIKSAAVQALGLLKEDGGALEEANSLLQQAFGEM